MNPEDLKKLKEDMDKLMKFMERVQPMIEALETLQKVAPDIMPLLDWYHAREIQQISFPIDEASKNVLNAVTPEGNGTSTLTQSYSVSGGGGGSITGPKAYVTSVFIRVDGRILEVPVISTP